MGSRGGKRPRIRRHLTENTIYIIIIIIIIITIIIIIIIYFLQLGLHPVAVVLP
jgi:ABC-type bacteriocin/lantibiotic exporter with double-glycine peptidase domain